MIVKMGDDGRGTHEARSMKMENRSSKREVLTLKVSTGTKMEDGSFSIDGRNETKQLSINN